MATDFFGVSLAGRIRQFASDATGGANNVVELWTEPTDSALTKGRTPNQKAFKSLAYVSQIDMVLKQGENCSISLVLTPPFEDALFFMQSELVRFGVGRLEVELAYTTGQGAPFSTLQFSGFLQKPDVTIGNDITITLHALGVGYQMNVVGGTESQAFPPDTTWAEAVRLTLSKYMSTDGTANGLKIDRLYDYIDKTAKNEVTGEPFFRLPAVVTVGDKQLSNAKVVPGVIVKGPRNDWWFVKETLRNHKLEMIIEGNEVFVVDHTWLINNFGGTGKSRKKFLLRGSVDPTQNMYPILAFSSPTTATWLAPGVGRLRSFDVPKDKEEGESEGNSSAKDTPISRSKSGDPATFTLSSGLKAPDSGSFASALVTTKAGLADGNAPGLRGGIAERIARRIDVAERMHVGDPQDPDVKEQQDGHWQRLNMQSGIKGQFTTVGVPDLTPGETIEVLGFEPMGFPDLADVALFNGAYGVEEVRHSVGVGGWETTFGATLNYFPEAFREAVRAQQTAADQTSQAQVQTKLEGLGAFSINNLVNAHVPVEPIPEIPDVSDTLKKLKTSGRL